MATVHNTKDTATLKPEPYNKCSDTWKQVKHRTSPKLRTNHLVGALWPTALPENAHPARVKTRHRQGQGTHMRYVNSHPSPLWMTVVTRGIHDPVITCHSCPRGTPERGHPRTSSLACRGGGSLAEDSASHRWSPPSSWGWLLLSQMYTLRCCPENKNNWRNFFFQLSRLKNRF